MQIVSLISIYCIVNFCQVVIFKILIEFFLKLNFSGINISNEESTKYERIYSSKYFGNGKSFKYFS
jgi:hypothetical protein